MNERMTRRGFLRKNILMIAALFFAQIFARLIRGNPCLAGRQTRNQSAKISVPKEAKYYRNLAG